MHNSEDVTSDIAEIELASERARTEKFPLSCDQSAHTETRGCGPKGADDGVLESVRTSFI